MLHSPLASLLQAGSSFISNSSLLAVLSVHLLKVLLILPVSESHLASLPLAHPGKAYLKNEVINVELKWDPAAQEPPSSPRSAPHSDCSLG